MTTRPTVEPAGAPPSGWFRVEYRDLVPGLSSPSSTHHLVCKGEDWSALRQQLAEMRAERDEFRDTGTELQGAACGLTRQLAAANRCIAENQQWAQTAEDDHAAMLACMVIADELLRDAPLHGYGKAYEEWKARREYYFKSRRKPLLEAPTSQPSRERCPTCDGTKQRVVGEDAEGFELTTDCPDCDNIGCAQPSREFRDQTGAVVNPINRDELERRVQHERQGAVAENSFDKQTPLALKLWLDSLYNETGDLRYIHAGNFLMAYDDANDRAIAALEVRK